MIKLGNLNISSIYYGGKEISSVYYGSTLIYTKDKQSDNENFEAEILMVSKTGYKLLSEEGEYYIFDYKGTREYENNTYYEYSFKDMSILAPTRNVTKVEFPFEGYYMDMYMDTYEDIIPIVEM